LGCRAALDDLICDDLICAQPERRRNRETKVLAAISEGREPIGNGEDGLKALELAELLYALKP
jgi:hypothetical protein